MYLLSATVDWNSVVVSLLTATAASGVLLFAALWLLRSWLGARIKNEVDSQYSHRLETHKSTLRVESEKEIESRKSQLKVELDAMIEQFRADTAEQRAVHTIAASALGATISASAERKLKAIDAHWHAMFHGRQRAQKLLFPYDSLKKNEIKDVFSSKTPVGLRPTTAPEFEEFEKSYEAAHLFKPYLEDVTLMYFYAHQLVLGRALALLVYGFTDKKLVYWLDDNSISSTLRSLLSPDEIKLLEETPVGGLAQAILFIEIKFINSARDMISGRTASEGALAQAHQISAKLAKASIKQSVADLSFISTHRQK
ncbi:hypothetical protein [Corallococcus exiguus]|uniref:hypothetical protein n=1 Tax=Corallococcus exiguus TaxID=83462 RepID=UPI003DA36CD5